MPATRDVEAALVNDARLRRERGSPRVGDAFEALEKGLSDRPARAPEHTHRHRQHALESADGGSDPFVEMSSPSEPRLSYLVAALVLTACLAAGAAAAVLMQPDPAAVISALTASR
jgi:hypothetical protein